RLSILTNERPASLQASLTSDARIPMVPFHKITSTPIQVIQARPDVRAAERRLAEATALSGAAFAQLFPRLSLEGFYGAQHSDIYSSLSPWNAALNGLMPLLDFGRLRAQVD